MTKPQCKSIHYDSFNDDANCHRLYYAIRKFFKDLLSFDDLWEYAKIKREEDEKQ